MILRHLTHARLQTCFTCSGATMMFTVWETTVDIFKPTRRDIMSTAPQRSDEVKKMGHIPVVTPTAILKANVFGSMPFLASSLMIPSIRCLTRHKRVGFVAALGVNSLATGLDCMVATFGGDSGGVGGRNASRSADPVFCLVRMPGSSRVNFQS